MRVIDVECDIPTREVYEAELKSLEESGAEGLANYINIFGPKWEAEAGMALEEFEEAKESMTPLNLRKMIIKRNIEKAMTEISILTWPPTARKMWPNPAADSRCCFNLETPCFRTVSFLPVPG